MAARLQAGIASSKPVLLRVDYQDATAAGPNEDPGGRAGRRTEALPAVAVRPE